MHAPKYIGKKDANCFQRQNIYKGDLTVQIANCAVDGSRVPTDIPHVSDEGPNDLHEHIGPRIFVKTPGVLDSCECAIYSRGNLGTQYTIRHNRKVDSDLQDLLKVVATRDSLLTEGLLDSYTIEGQQVDDIWKVGSQPYKFEDVPDFRRCQAINVVQDHNDWLLKLLKCFTHLRLSGADSLFSVLSELDEQLRERSTTLDPRTHQRQPT